MAVSHDEPDITPPTTKKMQGARALLTVASLFVVIAGLRVASTFLVPVAVAFFLAVLSYPMMSWLMRRRVPHVVALILTVGSIVVVLGLLGWAGYGLLKNFASEMPSYLVKLKGIVDDTAAWLEVRGWVPGAVKAVAEFNLQSLIDLATSQDVMKQLFGYAGATFGTIAIFLGSLIGILVVLIFVLLEAPGTHSRVELMRQTGGPDLSLMLNSATDIQK
jgi:predicted PurR-regulated permease PerM